MSEAIKHNNVVIFDDRGIPSIMVRFENPRAAVTPEMFIIVLDSILKGVATAQSPQIKISI